MKIGLLLLFIAYGKVIPFALFNTDKENCTEWSSCSLPNGSQSKLYIRFCDTDEYGSAIFEIRNDNGLDAKFHCEINFKNGKKITKEVVIHHNDKSKFDFEDNAINYKSGISSWKFSNIQYGECGSFNTSNQKK